MDMNVIQIILIFIFSCVIGIGSVLDEAQVHRPLVACTIIGVILGDLKTGVIIGGTLEMMSLGWKNLGTTIALDTALASTVGTIVVIAGKQSIGVGIALAIPIATVGQVLDVVARLIAIIFQRTADVYAKKGSLKGIDVCHIGALCLQGIRVAVPTIVAALFIKSTEIQGMLDVIPKEVMGGIQVASGFIVIVGYAMLLNKLGIKYLMQFFVLGFIIAAFTNFNLVGLGILGAIIALIYVQLKYRNEKFNSKDISLNRKEEDK